MRPARPSSDPLSALRMGGFTLIELLIVLIIVGILGAFAFARLYSASSIDGRTYADQLGATLRYGQKMAIAQGRNVYARLDAGGVALCYQADCAPSARVLAPAGRNSDSAATARVCADPTWACEAPPTGVTVGVSSQFYFDPVGKPFALADALTSSVSTFATLNVPIGGSAPRRVVVERETGYVH
ncbi:MAG: prepilin-type N-terminal cleavage/methylation domain-containing protein [Pseudomonadota bacterium]